jgi:hypothetical protein
MTNAATLLKAGDHAAALKAMAAQLVGLDGPALKDALGTLATLGKKLDRSGWRSAAEKFAKDLRDPRLAFKLGFELLEDDLPLLAVVFLERAYKARPNTPDHISEYVYALEELGRNAEARDVLLKVEATQLRDTFELRFLLAFNHLLCCDVEACRALMPELLTERDEELAPLALELDHMVQRADALKGASPLNAADLRGWQYVINGGVLANAAAENGPGGRFLDVTDTPVLCRAGLAAVEKAAASLGVALPTVWAAADANSRILARAASEKLKVPLKDLPAHGTLEPGLVVVHDLEALTDAQLDVLQWNRAGQLLWVHATPWTREPAFAADVTTLLHHTFTPAFAASETAAVKAILDAPAPSEEPAFNTLLKALGALRTPAGSGVFQHQGARRRQRTDCPNKPH